MRLGTIKRISKEDMSKKGQVPGRMDPMLATLNEFIEKVSQALNNNLSFEDNFLCKVVETEFTDDEELIVSPDIPNRTGLRPYGVIPVNTAGAELDAFTWRSLDNGKVGVTFGFGSAVTAKCKIIILLR